MFKKTIYWDKYHQNLDYGFDDFFVKAIVKRPEWFSDLEKQKVNFLQHFNASTCPSFITLFKDSLLYTTPCDLLFTIRAGICQVSTPNNTNEWFQTSSHNSLGMEFNQLGDKWDKSLYNVKLNPSIKLQSTDKVEIIFFDSIYYKRNTNLIVAPGTMSVSNVVLQPNLNLFIDVTEDRQFLVEAGEVLAMLYFPQGLPNFKHREVKDNPRKKFIGDYNYRTKQYKK